MIAVLLIVMENLLLSSSVLAQPDNISYQAVIRDANGGGIFFDSNYFFFRFPNNITAISIINVLRIVLNNTL